MNGAQNLTEPVAAQADASLSNCHDWKYFDKRLIISGGEAAPATTLKPSDHGFGDFAVTALGRIEQMARLGRLQL
jgi:hypothetical protein